MNPTEFTALAGVIIAVISSVFVPLYLVRRGDLRAAAERLAQENADRAAGRELSWEKINEAIVKERDDLRLLLKEAEIKRAEDVRELRIKLELETTEMRARYDRELNRANDRIEQCTREVDRLRERLYGIQRQSESPTGGGPTDGGQ